MYCHQYLVHLINDSCLVRERIHYILNQIDIIVYLALINIKFLLLCHNCHGLVLCSFMRKFSCISGTHRQENYCILKIFMSQGCRMCIYQHFCTLQIILIKIKEEEHHNIQYLAPCCIATDQTVLMLISVSPEGIVQMLVQSIGVHKDLNYTL